MFSLKFGVLWLVHGVFLGCPACSWGVRLFRNDSESFAIAMARINDEQFILQASFFVLHSLKKGADQCKRRKHQFWVRSTFQKRKEHDVFNALVQELRLSDREYFFKQTCLYESYHSNEKLREINCVMGYLDR